MSANTPPAEPSETPETPAARAARTRSRLLLLGIVACFAVPLILAMAWLGIVRSGAAGDLGDTSRGELIHPAVPIEEIAALADVDGTPIDDRALHGIWTMLYVPAGECGETCRTNLYNMRQVRLALNNRMKRVQRVILPSAAAPLEAALLAEHPGLIVGDGDEGARAALLAQIEAAEGDLAPLDDALYLVDPMGNLMMRFPADLEPGAVLEDVKHLLKVSKIG